MDKGIDTGDILEQAEVEIGEEETAEELFERLAVVSAELMLSTLEKLEKGEIIPQKQDETKASYAPMIKKEMAELDFNKTAEEIHNAVRGFYSWPCAFFFINGKRIKAISCRIGDKTNKKAGTVIADSEALAITCGDGVAIRFLTLQPEGSKPMTAKQFLNGNKLPPDFVIGENNG